MGQGGYIWLANGTTYPWKRLSNTSIRMAQWFLPESLAPGEVKRIYVEYQSDWPPDRDQSRGDTLYEVVGINSEFAIKLRWQTGIQAVMTKMATSSQPIGSTVSLGWEHDGSVSFILAGNDPDNLICTSSNVLSSGWMQQALPLIGDRTLRHICMPSSHDAAISVVRDTTELAAEWNTKTQVRSISDQLGLGTRFFDIRPVIHRGTLQTGHYSSIGVLGWQGGNGQSIAEIVDQINRYLDTNKELVILQLSHAYNRDTNFTDFTESEWHKLFQYLQKNLHNRYLPATADLTSLRLNDLISDNKAAVLVLADIGTNIDLGPYKGDGFHRLSDFPRFDGYANVNSVEKMKADQFQKLKEKRTNPDQEMFALCWTLTQQKEDILKHRSILELARLANQNLSFEVLNNCSHDSYPNLISTDRIESTDPVAVAMAINILYAS
ncbi:hypothetical protein TWF281_006293 [Arthrobotrys megalospora]